MMAADDVTDRRAALRRYALASFVLLFVPLFFVGEGPARTVGYLALAATLWAAGDRGTLAAIARCPPFVTVAAYLGFVLVSVTWGNRGLHQFPEYVGRYLNMLAFVATVALVAVRAPGTLALALRAFAAAGALAALAAIALFATGMSLDPARLTGLGAVSNSVVAALLYGAVLMVLAFRLWPEARTPAERALVLAGCAVVLTAVALTRSRGPLTGAVLTLLTLLALQGRTGRRVAAGFVAVAAAGLLATIGWRGILERGFSYRFEVWAMVLQRVGDAPWLGLGSGSRMSFVVEGFDVSFPHSILLTALLTTGIVGLALLLVMLVALAVEAKRAAAGGDRLPAALLLYTVLYGLVDRQLDLRNLSPEYFTIWTAAGLLIGHRLRRLRDDLSPRS